MNEYGQVQKSAYLNSLHTRSWHQLSGSLARGMAYWEELPQVKRPPLHRFRDRPSGGSVLIGSAHKTRRQTLKQQQHTAVAAVIPEQAHTNAASKPHTQLLPYVRAYCESSSLHCMHYLVDARQQRWQRAMWFCIIVLTSVAATFVYFELADLYATQRIQTTILNTVHPIFFVPFPSVGVCLRNAIDWQRLQTAHMQHLPANVSHSHSEAAASAFRSFFGGLEDLRFDRMRQLEPLFRDDGTRRLTGQQLALLDGVHLLDVMRQLTLDCNDVFEASSCYWRKRAYNCCDLFTLERTEAGYCHVFNSMVGEGAKHKKTSNKYYPFHNAKAGDGSGLEVLIKLNASKLMPHSLAMRGIYVMVKQPEQWHDNVRFVDANTYTKIAITPQQTQTDQRTRVVGPEVRGCLFEDERKHPLFKTIPGLLYWRGNCRTRCHQEYLVKKCNCSTSLLFPKTTMDNFTECRAVDFKCLYNHEDTFSAERHEAENDFVDNYEREESMVCNCLNSCNQLLYTPYYTSQPLELNSVVPSLPTNSAATANASAIKWVRLDVHYQSTYMLKYNTHVRYTFVELLANFGGIIGLFLGASLLSAVELGYFVLMAVWEQLYWHYTDARSRRHYRRHHHYQLKQQHNRPFYVETNDCASRHRY